jgi:hypothetical protein
MRSGHLGCIELVIRGVIVIVRVNDGLHTANASSVNHSDGIDGNRKILVAVSNKATSSTLRVDLGETDFDLSFIDDAECRQEKGSDNPHKPVDRSDCRVPVR